MTPRRPFAAIVLSVAATIGGSTLGAAQTPPSGAPAPNAFQGFSRENKEPVKIEANSLEVHDRESYAVFLGNVTVQQGDSTLRSRELKVFYEGSLTGQKDKDKSGASPAVQAPRGAPNQRIRRLEATGGVTITSKDQKASGDLGVFDMRSNTATISGNVVVTQGPNVLRADRLVVDLNTGLSRLEAGGKGGPARVQGVFIPGSVKDDKKK